MGSRKRKAASRLCRECRRKTRHESGTCLSHRTEGPLPRYMARLDAAEAVIARFTEQYAGSIDPEGMLSALLAAWRKAKEASEEEQ